MSTFKSTITLHVKFLHTILIQVFEGHAIKGGILFTDGDITRNVLISC